MEQLTSRKKKRLLKKFIRGPFVNKYNVLFES